MKSIQLGLILWFGLIHISYGYSNYNLDIPLNNDLLQYDNINLVLLIDSFHFLQSNKNNIDQISNLLIDSVTDDFDPEIKFNDEVILNPSNLVNINVSTSIFSDEPLVPEQIDPSISNKTIVSVLDSNINLKNIKKLKDLFRSFSWKGIGISLRKSVINWNSFGVSIRLPVTVNFPEYDNIVYYPRIACFLGVGYPYSLYLTISMSLPTQTIMIPFLLFNNKHDSMRSLINKMTADSVRRYGISGSIKYNKDHGYHFSIGPTLSYIPGQQFMSILKKIILYIPNILICFSGDMKIYMNKLQKNIITFFKSNSLKNKNIHPINESKIPNNLIRPDNDVNVNNNKSIHNDNDINIAFANIIKNKKIKTSQYNWYRIIHWIQTKNPRLGYNIGGFYSTNHNNGMGSNILIELQPFYPLYKMLVTFKKTAIYQYYYNYCNKNTKMLSNKNTINQLNS